MTTTTTATRVLYNGDGSTDTFAIPFSFASSSEIVVELILISTGDVSLQTLTTDYTLSGTNVVMNSAPSVSYKLCIRLSPSFEQTLNLTEAQTFPAESVESALDALSRQVKALKDQLDNLTLKFPSNLLTSTTVVDTDISPGKIFKINSGGTGIELATVASLNGGANAWGDAVDADIIPDTTNTYDVGSSTLKFAEVHATSLYGTIQTAAQPNITSFGTLTSLTVDSLTFNGTEISSSGALSFVPASASAITFGGTNGVILPIGSTGQRVNAQGALRYNSTDNKLELYNGTSWVQYSAAGSPGSWSDVVDSDIIPDTDNTWDLGSAGARFAEVRANQVWGTLQTAAQTNVTSLGTLTALTVDNISIDGNTVTTSSGNIEIPEIIDNSGITSHLLIAKGTTAQRTGTTAGQVRYNTTDNKLEFYNGSGWRQVDQVDSAGDMIHLSTQTVSAQSAVNFTSLMSNTYKYYKVIFRNLIPATNGTQLWIEVSTDNGSTYKTGASDYQAHCCVIGSGSVGSEATFNAALMQPSGYNFGSSPVNVAKGEILITGAHDTSVNTGIQGHIGFGSNNGYSYIGFGNNQYSATTEVNAFRMRMSSGNISGTFSLYGIK